jgi:hypothetical protein
MLTCLLLSVVAAFTKKKTFTVASRSFFLVWNLAFAGMMLIAAQDALGAELFQNQ